jgi:formylglycine-generating enzyme required for sulfatase activity
MRAAAKSESSDKAQGIDAPAAKLNRLKLLVTTALLIVVCAAGGYFAGALFDKKPVAATDKAAPVVVEGDGVRGPVAMVWVPGGEFLMGSDHEFAKPNEKPTHRVRVKGFWMDRTHVTNAQFAEFVKATG